MPGGDAAVREPWRMACAWLVAAGEEEPALPPPLTAEVAPARWRAIAELARTGLSAPETSSMGRLFDAVAALCGVRSRVNYEGQAAVELEAVADRGPAEPYPMPVRADGVLDAGATVRAAVDDVSRGTPASAVSARFHAGVAEATAVACARAASEQGVATVVLSGGVFQNRLLLERTAALLGKAGLRVFVPERLPPNDGGVAYGQAAVAAARGG
jgi:hydrogenase maturation protein HypF